MVDDELTSYWDEFRNMNPNDLSTDDILTRIFDAYCTLREMPKDTKLDIKIERSAEGWSAFLYTEAGAKKYSSSLSCYKRKDPHDLAVGLYLEMIAKIKEFENNRREIIAEQEADLAKLAATRSTLERR